MTSFSDSLKAVASFSAGVFTSLTAKKGEGTESRLDFMSTVLRVAAVGFYGVGTKLGFDPQRMLVQRASPSQGGERKGRGDKRDDLVKLLAPLCTALVVYPPDTPYRIIIYDACKRGLLQLKATYAAPGAVETLRYENFACRTLQDCIDFIDQQKISCKGEKKEGGSFTAFDITKHIYSESLRNAVVHKALWTEAAQQMFSTLLTEAKRLEGVSKAETEAHIQGLLTIIDGKDAHFAEIIKTI